LRTECRPPIALGGNDEFALSTADGNWKTVSVSRASDPGQLLSTMQSGLGSSAVRLMKSADSDEGLMVVAASVPLPPELPKAAFWVDERSARIHAVLRRRDLITQ
jgi:hypothetical protein